MSHRADPARATLGLLLLCAIASCRTPIELAGTPTSDAGRVDAGDDGLSRVRVSLGPEHGCARLATGTLECWGVDRDGQVAADPNVLAVRDCSGVPCVERATPTTAVRSAQVDDFALAARHTCALMANREVRCWGRNDLGQLGIGVVDADLHREDLTPTMVDAVELVAGRHHTCARAADGTVRCWGLGARGALGRAVDGRCTVSASLSAALGDVAPGDVECASAPVRVGLDGPADALVAGPDSTCARVRGVFVCWGANSFAELGRGVREARSSPAGLSVVPDVAQLAIGARHACAVDTAGEVWCWGAHDRGQLGVGQRAGLSDCEGRPCTVSALPLRAADRFERIACGDAHTCAITSGGATVRCWGDASHYAVGRAAGLDDCGGTPCMRVPVRVDGDESFDVGGWLSVHAAGDQSCARRRRPPGQTRDGTPLYSAVACWGRNDHRQLGVPSAPRTAFPIQVYGLEP